MPKLETKSAVILLSTFILGLFLGLISSQYLIRQRLEPIRHRSDGPKIGVWLERAIHPNEDQREKLEEITSEFRKKMRNLRKKHMNENRALIDSLMTSVRPHLTEEQMKYFERFQMRSQGHVGRMKNQGPQYDKRWEESKRRSKRNY